MTTNFNRFRQGNVPEKPSCFSEAWESDDSRCRKCFFFDECGQVFQDKERASLHRASAASYAPPRTTSTYHYPTTYHQPPVPRTTDTEIKRPEPVANHPAGTEYLPEERRGKAGPVRRFTAIALSEGLSAGLSQIGRALTQFGANIVEWHPHAGRTKYGDKWNGENPKPKQRKPKFPVEGGD